MINFYKIIDNKLVPGSGKSAPDDTWLTDWSLLETKEDGSYATYYNEDMTIDIAKETEIAINEARRNMVKAIESHIQAPIDAYNEANNTLFESAHNCSTYLNVPTYSHYDFCKKIVEFNVSVWEKGRSIEAEVLAGARAMPTVEELIDELPKFTV